MEEFSAHLVSRGLVSLGTNLRESSVNSHINTQAELDRLLGLLLRTLRRGRLGLPGRGRDEADGATTRAALRVRDLFETSCVAGVERDARERERERERLVLATLRLRRSRPSSTPAPRASHSGRVQIWKKEEERLWEARKEPSSQAKLMLQDVLVEIEESHHDAMSKKHFQQFCRERPSLLGPRAATALLPQKRSKPRTSFPTVWRDRPPPAQVLPPAGADAAETRRLTSRVYRIQREVF